MVASGPLAYVFWHCSREQAEKREQAEEYEERLLAFHDALADHPPSGFLRSYVRRYSSLPWAPSGREIYEDWYVIADFGAVGRLNEAAASGPRQPAHDRAAAAAGWGAAGVYRKVTEDDDAGEDSRSRDGRRWFGVHASRSVWFSKPEDVSYGRFLEQLNRPSGLWQRQMVLGPAPEFCLFCSEWSHPEFLAAFDAPFVLLRA